MLVDSRFYIIFNSISALSRAISPFLPIYGIKHMGKNNIYTFAYPTVLVPKAVWFYAVKDRKE